MILENGVIVNFNDLKKITNSGIEKCVCKIINDLELKSGTGFFCKANDLKLFITNYHVINNEFLKNKKKLIIEIEEEEKEINLELERYKISDKENDFIIIQILEQDNIKNFLKIDEDIFSKDYEKEIIFTCQYPGGGKLNYSHGEIIHKKHNLYIYTLGTQCGSSGSPIILFDNLKVIALHRASIRDKNNNNKKNLGIPLNIIFQSINSIKCIYEIKDEDINKDIQIINNGYKGNWDFIEKNKEIMKKIEIIIDGQKKSNIMKYKFDKEGKYIIYIKEKEKIKDMSYMFWGCEALKSIDLSNYNNNNVTNLSWMFSFCESLESITFSNFKTDKVTNMSWMFSYCKSLKSLDLSNYNTNSLNNMSHMFSGCESLISINLSNFNTKNVTDMSFMFYNC